MGVQAIIVSPRREGGSDLLLVYLLKLDVAQVAQLFGKAEATAWLLSILSTETVGRAAPCMPLYSVDELMVILILIVNISERNSTWVRIWNRLVVVGWYGFIHGCHQPVCMLDCCCFGSLPASPVQLRRSSALHSHGHGWTHVLAILIDTSATWHRDAHTTSVG